MVFDSSQIYFEFISSLASDRNGWIKEREDRSHEWSRELTGGARWFPRTNRKPNEQLAGGEGGFIVAVG